MAKIEIKNLVKKFGATVAVNNMNLEIKDKDFVCLLGPSGCGKTSTLRMIAGLETPTSGEIYIDDKRVTHLPPKDRNISMVFQFYAMYPNMNVFDQIAFPLKVKGTPKTEIKERIEYVAKRLKLDHILDRYMDHVTMGEKQRIEIARAMVKGTSLFMFDEPLTHLEASLKAGMRAEIKELHEELGVTMIYVTHDQLEAIAMADKIAVMDQGHVLQYDEPGKLYEHPNSLFVAGFIGSPAMNFIKGSISKKGGELYFSSGELKCNVSKLIELNSEEITNRIGTVLILGVRPEDISLSNSEVLENSVVGEVSDVEHIGDRSLVDVEIGDMIIESNVRLMEVEKGDKINIKFNKIHLFDEKTEKAIF